MKMDSFMEFQEHSNRFCLDGYFHLKLRFLGELLVKLKTW